MEDFIGMFSAVIRKVGCDVSVKGYKVIFTDIGPESFERYAPEKFRKLTKRSTGGGVQVRGFSRAVERDGHFVDRQTGERGVALYLIDMEEDGQGGRIVTGVWLESPSQENPPKVEFLVVRQSTKWKAQPCQRVQTSPLPPQQ
jgi:hypothetical protein